MAGIIIGAPASGSGKTMITCGLLELFKRKGLSPWAFKCGPDYIDGLFHRQVLQVEGGNLDSFFETKEQLRGKLARAMENHFVVAEGVMGYFDGLGGNSTKASTCEVAAITGLPAVLLVDARGASLSLIAQIQGFLNFSADVDERLTRPGNGIQAVIFNRLSPAMYPRMREQLERFTGVKAAGFVPELPFLKVGSRHLGLVLPEEIPEIRQQMERLADALEQSVDWQILVRLGENVPDFRKKLDTNMCSDIKSLKEKSSSFRLGVAKDEAFCFYYQDNLTLLEKAGAELVPFSPIHDKKLPENLDGLLLGGGYPENHGAALEANEGLRREIREAAEGGMPILAECGGYLYLLEQLEGSDGRDYAMTAVFPGKGFRKGKNSHFGYITVSSEADTPYLKRGEEIRGHEFHYWERQGEETALVMQAGKPAGSRSWPCMQVKNKVQAGFPHLYYPSCPEFAKRFSEQCRMFANERRQKSDL